MIKKYISITKPGIIFGNIVTVAGGFFLASNNYTDWLLFATTLLGIALVIASGCVFNNIIDRDIDRLMERTKNRVMVHGLLSKKVAFFYGVVLMLIGSALLYRANALTLEIALIGLFFYVIVYTLAFKRNSVYGTLVGSVSGAIPPLVGYCAVRNSIDAGAVILFLILTIWQMPHSYAIAIFRFKDYKAANIPVLPIKKGAMRAKISILIHTILFLLVSTQLYFWNYAGIYYLAASIIVSIWWIILAIKGFSAKNDEVWAKKLFGASIVIIMVLSFMMAINTI
ncbi:MAG: heme o synthase [Burkholderiales bacterium]|nr:heme o synthase [Burkholderiales bacterium]